MAYETPSRSASPKPTATVIVANLTVTSTTLPFWPQLNLLSGTSYALGQSTASWASLGTGTFYATMNDRVSLSNFSLVLTAKATRLSDLYWKIDYFLNNTGTVPVEADLALRWRGSSYHTARPFESNGVLQGVTLASTAQPLATFTFIVANHPAVNSVTGCVATTGTTVETFSYSWSTTWSISTSTSVYLMDLGLNWQKIPVDALSSAVITILVGHGDPPDDIPAAQPTPLPVITPAVFGFESLDVIGESLSFSMNAVDAIGRSQAFPSAKAYVPGSTYLMVNENTTVTSSAAVSNLSLNGVILTRTANRLSPTWWEINFHLTNRGDSPAIAGIAYFLSMQSGWMTDIWSPYRDRGMTVQRDCNDLHYITFILRNTSFVNPVTGWSVRTYSSVTASDIWTRTRTTSSLTSSTLALVFNWQDIPVHPEGTTSVTFLVGTGPVPATGDLAEPTRSPSRSLAKYPTPSRTPLPTRSQSRSPTSTRTPLPTRSRSRSPSRTRTLTETRSRSPDLSGSPPPSTTPTEYFTSHTPLSNRRTGLLLKCHVFLFYLP
jgi:hypothetical protein